MSAALLFYDCETTGIPDWGKPSADPCQPRITQLCGELVDESGKTIESLCEIIKPDGWVIPLEIATLTGITTERAAEVGKPIAEVLEAFLALWCRAVKRVAHNESFDMRMVRIEILRSAVADPQTAADEWKRAPGVCCTMRRARTVMGGKQPTLGEAYRHFMGEEMVGAHNAAVDVAACRAVYFATT